jgi:hypothetical protein
MKITLDQDTLAKAVIAYLQGVGVQSDILGVDFRYTRVPYTVFAEVELVEPKVIKPMKAPVIEERARPVAEEVPLEPLVDPEKLPPEAPEPDEPRPEIPAAPLFSGGG